MDAQFSSGDSTNAADKARESMGFSIGVSLGLVALLVILISCSYLIWKTFINKNTPVDEHAFPAAEPAPPHVECEDYRVVEGAVLVGDENRGVLDNASALLTLVHSTSSPCPSPTSSPTPMNAHVARHAAASDPVGQNDSHSHSARTGVSVSRPLARSSQHPRYPKEIHDTSTNSVFKLYKRRSSRLVYGSSAYISPVASLKVGADRLKSADTLADTEGRVDPTHATPFALSSAAAAACEAEGGAIYATVAEIQGVLHANNRGETVPDAARQQDGRGQRGNEPFS